MAPCLLGEHKASVSRLPWNRSEVCFVSSRGGGLGPWLTRRRSEVSAVTVRHQLGREAPARLICQRGCQAPAHRAGSGATSGPSQVLAPFPFMGGPSAQTGGWPGMGQVEGQHPPLPHRS